MSWLERFMDATAWEIAEPRAYGAFHLIFTFVGIALCIFLAWKLRNIGERGNRAVLLTVGIFLVITEIYKQFFYFYHMENNEYAFWIFPFQLCSVPMYLCIIASLIKPGKVQTGMYGFMTTFNLLGGLMAFIEPSGILHEHLTLLLHAFVWHMSLVFIGFYLIASGRCAKSKRDYKYAVFTFLSLALLAFIINLILWVPSDGSINMFFVGPRNSSLVVFKWISEKFGWYVSTLLYLPTVSLGAYIIFLPVHLYYKKKAGKDRPTAPQIEEENKIPDNSLV